MLDCKNQLKIVLAKVIKKYRKDKSISQICNEINLNKCAWSKLEKGNRELKLSTFWRIAEALEIKPHLLLKEVEEELGENFSFLEDM